MKKHAPGKILRILIIDDDQVDRISTIRLLRASPDTDFRIEERATMEEGVAAVKAVEFDCVLLDYRLPDGDAIQVLDALRAASADGPPVILQTVLEDEERALTALRHGAQDYLIKGRADSAMLLRAIRYAIQRDGLIKERNRLARELAAASVRIQTLEGILPICGYCKRIRDDRGVWQPVELYMSSRTRTQFSHGICTDCMREHFPDVPLDDR